MEYKKRTIDGYSKDNIDNIFKANEKLASQLQDLKLENTDLKKDKKRLEKKIEKAFIEISALMSKYFYDDYVIEDADLDKILRLLDGSKK